MFLFLFRKLNLEKQQKSFTCCNFFVVIMHFKVKSTVSKMYGFKQPNIDTNTQQGPIERYFQRRI